MYLSWVIPVYNEEKKIEKTLREVDAYLSSKNFSEGYEIIVVNNGSKDNTKEVVEKLSTQMPAVKILNVHEKGKGGAVRRGMLEAVGEIRAFADADNSVSPEQAEKFISLVCGEISAPSCFDIVIGSIEVPGAVIQEHAQWYRRFLGRTAKLVIRLVSGLWEVHDSQRGFKFFSQKAAEKIFPRQTLTGWGFDFEVLLIAKRQGFKIKEVPVVWINPAGSKVGLSAYATTLVELLQIKWNDIKGLYK